PVQVAAAENAATPAASDAAPAAAETQAVAALEPSAPAITDSPSADGTSFRWPVRGRIIADFGTRASGERNDGINLSVPEGTSIRASEAGRVIYAGNELPSYGNLVLIEHADGWVTAYAHASEILVSRGQTVQRGQAIALAGSTGGVNSPQLHFELRRGSTPVNPLDYLTD
ncbi:MAG: M23 family metallopeptidase, partial [Bauldia sp.]|nr:M23 family metallopeptidase [Bauldia sp.]